LIGVVVVPGSTAHLERTLPCVEASSAYQPQIFFIWRMRGPIRDLEVHGDHLYRFNTTRVVDSYFAVIFIRPCIGIPVFLRSVSRNERIWFLWQEYSFSTGEVTEDRIDFVAVYWRPWYPESMMI
jgi:hypothetical protein